MTGNGVSGSNSRGVRAVHADDVARELRDGHLHAEADAQERDLLLAGDPRGGDLALDPALAEAARDQDAVDVAELLARVGVAEALGVHPHDLDAAAELEARVAQRLDHGQVGVLELHVLADQRDPDRVGAHRLAGAADELVPVAQLRRRRLHPEVVEDEVVHALRAVDQRHLVDVVHVARRDDRVVRQRGEQRDLAAHVLRQAALGAAHQHVGLDADAAQLVDRVLGRLGLQLAGVADVRHEREVDEHAPAPARRRPGTAGSPPGTAATRCRPPCRRSP